MAELLTLFRAIPPDGPFDRSDGNRLTPAEPWPGLWSLPQEDRSVVHEVSRGRRRKALVTAGQRLHWIEYQPGILDVTGEATGYTVRTLDLSGSSSPQDRSCPVSTEPEPIETVSPSPRTQTVRSWLLIAGCLVAALTGGVLAQMLPLLFPNLSARTVPERGSRDRERQEAAITANAGRLEQLEQALVHLSKKQEAAQTAVPPPAPLGTPEAISVFLGWMEEMERSAGETRKKLQEAASVRRPAEARPNPRDN